MLRLTIAEASRQLGVSIHTLKGWLRRGELEGEKRATPQGFVWVVKIPENSYDDHGDRDGVAHGLAGSEPAYNAGSQAAELRRMEELVAALQAQIHSQQEELEARRQ